MNITPKQLIQAAQKLSVALGAGYSVSPRFKGVDYSLNIQKHGPPAKSTDVFLFRSVATNTLHWQLLTGISGNGLITRGFKRIDSLAPAIKEKLNK